jgi:hypothetical protein
MRRPLFAMTLMASRLVIWPLIVTSWFSRQRRMQGCDQCLPRSLNVSAHPFFKCIVNMMHLELFDALYKYILSLQV